MTGSRQTGAISKLKQIYRLLSDAEIKRLILLFFIMLLVTLIEVVGVGSIFPLLQILSTPEKFAQGAIATHLKSIGLTSTKEISLFLIGVFGIFLVSSNFLSLVVFRETNKFAWTNWRNISTRTLEHYLHQPYEFFLGRNSADLTKVVTQDSLYLGYAVVLPLLHATAKLLVILALALTLFVFEPVVTLVLLAFFVSTYAALALYSQRVVRMHASVAQRGRTQSTRVASEALRGIKEVKAFGREGHFVRQFAREVAPVPNAEKSIAVLGGAPRYYLESLTIALVLTGMAVAIYREVNLAAQIPSVGLFMVAGYRMLPLFSQAFSSLNDLMARLITIDDMLADLRLHEVAHVAVEPASGEAADPSSLTEIALADITYSYPKAPAPALRKISLTLEPGKKIGLLGVSGGGKSTLIDVLLTLLEPQSGQIRMGDMLIEKSNTHRLRSRIGYVPQSIYLTDQTIVKNIAFGVDEKEIDMEAVVRAAKQANIHEFIVSLQQGYQTVIGELGIRLSGGQRQRLGIARALYSDPPIIVFDEGTSALDTETEAAVMDAINHLDNKTVLMAAHRLSTLRKCDVVYEVKNGQLSWLGRGETVAQRN